MPCRCCLALACTPLGSLFKTLAVLWTQQRCSRGPIDLAQRLPEPEVAVADSEFRADLQAAAAQIHQQLAPRLLALAIAVGEPDQFLSAELVRADHDQDALALLIKTSIEVDAIDPEVDVALAGQTAPLPGSQLGLPGLFQPADGRRRQTRRVRPEQRAQGLGEVTTRDALQIKPWQELLERASPAQIARQDRRGELDLGAAGGRATVAHPGLTHCDRPDPGLDRALRQETITHQAPAAGVVDQLGMSREERLDLGFDRLGQQRARPVPQHLGQRILRSIVWAAEADNVIPVHGVSDPSSKG